MKITVSLTGGLGNQLFQLAAGLNLVSGRNLHLISSLGNPRTNIDGEPELYSFDLPDNLVIDINREANWLVRRSANYLLRISASPRKLEASKFFRAFVSSVASIPLSLFLGQKTSIVYTDNVGYSDITLKDTNSLLLGYFQTFLWADNPVVKDKLKQICSKNFISEIEYFRNLAIIERPVVVHVRLTDYLREESFGLLTKNYYAHGIEKILQTTNCKSIWLFSDDTQMARSFLPTDCNLPVRVIDQINGSTALAFEIMRMGYGYVIANSTFSWWAAYLSSNLDVEVVAPQPWFIEAVEPEFLIPKHWKRISRY